MRSRAFRLARHLWVLYVCVWTVALWLTWLNRELVGPFEAFTIALLMIGIGGFATVGAVISRRRPDNAIGWIFQLFTLGLAVAIAAGEYARRALVTAPGSLPGGRWALWLNTWLIIPAICLLPLSFLLFPDGSLPSRRWRLVGWALAIGGALATISNAFGPRMIQDELGHSVANPAAVGPEAPLRVLAAVGVGMILAAVFGSVAALVVRFRRSHGVERQQIRWLAYAASVPAVLFLMTLVYAIFGDPEQETVLAGVLWFGWTVTLAIGVPAATAVAILRYRLYDLDLVVKRTVQYGLLAAVFTAITLVFSLALPVLFLGAGSGADLLPGLVTGLVIAIAYQPLRARARRLADRIVYGKRATPFEALSQLADRVAGAYASEDVLPRMARIVVDGTGATRCEVWLRVGSELRLEAAVPDEDGRRTIPLTADDLPAFPGSDGAFPVRLGDDLLGAITVSVPASEPLTTSQETLIRNLAAQAGLVLRNVRLIEELQASRQRLVAAQDEERRRLERNLHDGAQQQLVALAVKLQLAEQMTERDPPKVRQMLSQLRTETSEALENLRDLARGIYPPLLADEGLAAAIEAQARKAPIPVEVSPDRIGRYRQEVEAAVYFCCLEALQNVAKYASASRVAVRLSQADGTLTFEVTDDGVGFDPTSTVRGTGLQGMADRLDAIGGSLTIVSRPGGGTTVTGQVPVGPREPGHGTGPPSPARSAGGAR